MGEFSRIRTSLLTQHRASDGAGTERMYNRRFAAMQIIGVYAAEVQASTVQLDPHEHAVAHWCDYEQAYRRVSYKGLKDGLRSTCDSVTGVSSPPPELRLL
jgi:hypothetical protein